MKKYIFCFLLIPMLITERLGFAQSIPNPVVMYSPDSIKLMGRGDFGGVDSDQGKTFYYNLNVGDNYRFIARVNSHTGATARGKVIAFLKDVNPANETAGNRAMHFISAELGQIAFYSRPTTNTRTRKLASVQVSGYPSWLYIEKKGDSVITKYSLSSASTPIASITWASLGRYANAFTGWTNIKKGIGVASGSTSYSSANVSKFSVQGTGGSVTPTNIQGITDGQIIAYWNAYGSLRPVKARIFAGKLWATDASSVLDNYFFVRGGNFLSRTDVTIQNSFSATKIQYFEGTTGFGGLVSPPNFTTPSGYMIGTNLSISGDGTPYYEPINSLPNCAGNLFTILSATQQTGLSRGEYIFNAINASKHRWNLYYGVTLMASDTVTATSSRIVFNIPSSVSSGNYTLKVDIQNCTATDSRAFSYAKPDGGVISAPTIASNPNPATVGSNIALTASNCSFTVDWFKNNVFQSSAQSFAVSSAVLNDIYSAKCRSGANSSNFSNQVVIQDVATQGGNGGQTVFANMLKIVPVETALGKYNPDAFPTISVTSSADAVLSNKLFPNWSVSWKVEGLNFSNSTRNKKTPNVGIPFMFDLLATPYGGYGQRCVDYIYPQNPSNGQIWASDDACGGVQFNQYFGNLAHTNANFSSALPFEERAGDGGGAGLDKITEWNGISDLGYFYDQGHVGSERFGFRDWVNGKANIGLADYDNEGTFDTNKSLAILLGLASKSSGYVFDQYANILGAVYIDPSQYPIDFNNPNSLYPQYSQLINETNGEPNSGGAALVANTIPNRQFWDPTYKIAIASKFTGTKGIIDEPTILPSTEVSCLSSATFRQGESYVYNTTGSTRVVNKFGLNANTQHMIARTIFAAETHKWYCVNKLNNRKMIIQAKILCDQQQNGLLLDQNYGNSFITNTSLANKHFDREYGFDIGAFVALTGCEWNVWDRNNADQVLDGYHGAFGIINLLSQRKNFGSESKSFVDLKPTAKFLLWTSQISYDNGLTYLTEKANKYAMNQSSIPQRQFITPDGYWGGFLARPENTEATSCVLRVMYNGQNYTHTVTPAMWETVDYSYRNTDLASLPSDKKDYYYFLIKLTNGATTESTTISPPSITSNVTSPTTNQSVTLTSSGCQSSSYVTKWYTSSEGNLLATGSTYTVSATNGSGYYAACVGSTNSSIASNIITFSINSNLTPVNVFVFVGESNAGTRNASSTLLAGEGGPRTGVRIWNNANNQLEQLNVGTNNYQGENATVANGWGWEVQLANLRANGTLNSDFVIVKTAEGGALIGQYNTDISGGYYSIMQSRINGVKNALQAEGKTPTFYVMYSQGINNALYPNIDDQAHFPGVTGINYWQSATTTMLSNLRSLMGANTNISLMKFPNTYGTYLNGAITNLVNNNALNSFINTSDLGIQSDGLHFDAPATRIITDRYISVIGLPLSPVVQTTTPTTTGVTVTQPAKAPYFFSNNQSPSFYTNRANKPSVFTNASTFDAVNDVVYLQNSDVKYGINLKRGGQLCYASLTGTDNNLVFNGYDGGFQVQLDATQILSPATVQGQTSGSPQNNNAYNTTIGGDYLNQATTLIDYHTVGTNGYYVKFRPLLYPFNGLISEVEIEATYTLIGRALKVEYKYTSFRTDGNYPINPTAPGGLKGWAVPVSFLVEKLNRYQTYTGTSPWNINSPVEDGDIPNTTPNQGGGVLLGKNTKEFWGLSYNSSENLGLGSLNMSEGGSEGYMTWEQREKYAGNSVGGVFGNGGRTTMDILSNVLVPDGGNFTKTTTAFIAIGTPLQIRQSFYTNTGH